MSSPPASLDVENAQRFEQACIAMEQATDATTRNAADAYLQAARLTPKPYTLCLLVLEGSKVPNAHYHALSTMKAAIQREGRVLGGGFLVQLKDQLLNCLVQRSANWTGYVIKQCVHVIAILFKWICLEEDESRLRVQQQTKTTIEERPAYINLANCVASFLQQGATPQSPTSPPGAPSSMFFTLLALELSKALIAEFTQGTSHSNAGVSVSMHVRCHSNFEQHVLFNLAQLILTQSLPNNLASLTALSNSPPGPPFMEGLNLLHGLLSFIDVLLSFPFEDPKHVDALALRWALLESDQPQQFKVKPSAKWQGLLVSSQLLEMVTHACNLLSSLAYQSPQVFAQFQAGRDTRHLARYCLLQLASISGPVLNDPPPPPDASQIYGAPPARQTGHSRTQLGWVARLIQSMNGLMERSLTEATKPGAATIDEEIGLELIGYVMVLKRLLWPGCLTILVALPDSSQVGKLITLQHAVSMLLIPFIVQNKLPTDGGGLKKVNTDTTKTECFDLCLENWNSIISELQEAQWEEEQVKEKLATTDLYHQVKQWTGAIFEAYVLQRLQSTTSHVRNPQGQHFGANDSDDEGDEDEDEGQFMESSYVDTHLSDVASLGKPHAQAALHLVTTQLNLVLKKWQEVVTANNGDSAVLYSIHESFYFLLRLLGHLIGCGGSWNDWDDGVRYRSIPKHILEMIYFDQTGHPAATLQAAVDTVLNLANLTNQLLNHNVPQPSSSGSITTQSSPLKEFCSPLVFETLIWLFQQFVAAGYFLIDQGLHEDAEINLPVPLLELYSGGNSKRNAPFQPPTYGRDAEKLLNTLVETVVSFLKFYSEESFMIDATMRLLELCVKHVPMRLLFKQQLLSPQTQVSLFKSFFLQTFMTLFTTDPYQLLLINNENLLLQFQSSQYFYHFPTEILTQLTDILIQCLTFKIEKDCNDLYGGEKVNKQLVQEERTKRRQQSIQALHALMVPVMESFFRLLMNPQFTQFKVSTLMVKFVHNYVAFFTGCVRDIFVDNFEFLWHWMTATDSMIQIPLMMGGQNGGNMDHLLAQLSTAQKQQELQQMRNHASSPTTGAAPSSRQNIVNTLTEIVRQYNTDEVISMDETGTSLGLCSGILQFFGKFTECFLPYLSQGQSFYLMQSVLTLVNVFTNLIEHRSAANKRALQLNAQQSSSQSAQRKQDALKVNAGLLDTAEWQILHSLLQLLERVSDKDRVDFSEGQSTSFASDAVLNGLMLLIPRLSGNMLARSTVAGLFFNLLSNLVTVNPDKLAALNENQRNQLLEVILFVLDSETPVSASQSPEQRSVLAASSSAQLHSTLLKEVCAAVQAIAQYHLYFVSGKAEHERQQAAIVAQQEAAQGTSRGLRAEATPPPSPFASACTVFLRSLLRVLLHAHLSPTLLDPLADALLPTILAQPPVFMDQVRELIEGWKQKQLATVQRVLQTLGPDAAAAQQRQMESLLGAIESGFHQLIPSSLAQSGVTGAAARTYFSSKTMAVERSVRFQFRKQMRDFVLTVRPLIAAKDA